MAGNPFWQNTNNMFFKFHCTKCSRNQLAHCTIGFNYGKNTSQKTTPTKSERSLKSHKPCMFSPPGGSLDHLAGNYKLS